MKAFVKLALRSRVDTAPLEKGKELLRVLSSHGGLLAPEQVSHNADRFKDAFVGEQSLEQWWSEVATLRAAGVASEYVLDFAWRRKATIRSKGYLRHTMRNRAGKLLPCTLSITAEWNRRFDWYGLFNELVDKFPPQLAMLHLFTDAERSSDESSVYFEAGSFGALADPQPINLAWANYYGDEFAQEGARSAMKESGFDVSERDGGYLVKVTGELSDLERDIEKFWERRRALRQHFRPGFFELPNIPHVLASQD
ncbi:hypothetical protein [Stenotrophomonas sp. 278]|uniref:hypothetical protein n=1 Tax=Stenotrophomonas sp. 278 TaxID=2479851 RepID=UPI000F66291B|nr:hypothetical protein [Stenotrophomonas sp. 278]RRU13845.1 hypothetical protein EGJ34_11030 [Stenotrophomonas sp. 278]